MDPHPVLVRAFSMPGGTEWVIILIIALLIFGPKLPSIMRGLGGSVKEFKKGMDEGPTPTADANRPTQPPAPPPAAPSDSKKP